MAYSWSVRPVCVGSRYRTVTPSTKTTGASDLVGELISRSRENPPTQHERDPPHHHPGAEGRRDPAVIERRPDAVDEGRHGVQRKKPAKGRTDDRRRVDHGREVHPRREEDLVEVNRVGKISGER